MSKKDRPDVPRLKSKSKPRSRGKQPIRQREKTRLMLTSKSWLMKIKLKSNLL